MPLLQNLFIRGLSISTALRTQLPEVRRRAIMETIGFIQSPTGKGVDQEAMEVIFRNIRSSPWLTTEKVQSAILEVLQSTAASWMPEIVNELAEMILDSDWDDLLRVSSNADIFYTDMMAPLERDESEKIESFRAMVIEVFACSRKVAIMDDERQISLAERAFLATTIEELINVRCIL